MSSSKDRLDVGSKVTLPQDVDIRGHVTIGTGTVVHPKAAILALSGPITIGASCIVEENVTIINRSPSPLVIGSQNLFEVGSHIEARSIGDHNTFEVKSRVSSQVAIGSFTTISAGCAATAAGTRGYTQEELGDLLGDDDEEAEAGLKVGARAMKRTPSGATETILEEGEEGEAGEGGGEAVTAPSAAPVVTLPDYTVFTGSVGVWSGQGRLQEEALHAKHLDYLRQAIPKSHKLRAIV